MFTIPENNWDFITEGRVVELQAIYDSVERYYPCNENVLRFLDTDFNNLKYIIVGMEPYPTSAIIAGKEMPEATGRSFEVNSLRYKTWNDKFKQSSLRNILKAIHYAYTGRLENLSVIREEINDGSFKMAGPGKWFDDMESQGVLFLNASLTVEPYNVGSHKALWDKFMTQLIMHIEENKDVIWLLWGNDAKERVDGYVKNKICTCHPRLNDFVLNSCFKDEKLQLVDWRGI